MAQHITSNGSQVRLLGLPCAVVRAASMRSAVSPAKSRPESPVNTPDRARVLIAWLRRSGSSTFRCAAARKLAEMDLTVEIATGLWSAISEPNCGCAPQPERSCCIAHVACHTLIDMMKRHMADTATSPLEISMRGLAKAINESGSPCTFVKIGDPTTDAFAFVPANQPEPRQSNSRGGET